MRRNYVLIIAFFLISCFACGCVNRSTGNHQAVDDISKVVREDVNGKFNFMSCVELDNGETRYNFEIRDFDSIAIGEFVEACNSAVLSVNEPISFSALFYASGRGMGMFYVQNFNDNGELLDGMRYLRIWDPSEVNEQAANPALYSEIEGITELHVDRSIQDKADDMGIDWYNYWPDLETVVIED